MHSWHDFHITGYTVNGKGKELAFDLEWPYESKTDIQRARLRFTGVECYYLEHDLGSNIVYAFEDKPLRVFLSEWTERFEIEYKWGWPKFWRVIPYPPSSVEAELESAFQLLSGKGVRCIEISSSYGLSGWVLASNTEYLPIEA